jgi:hypothetical protein
MIEFVPNIVDFQVVFKDKEGNEFYPVCDYCGPVENSQGSGTDGMAITKGQANMKKVHTAEIYLTIDQLKKFLIKNQATRIINHEGGTYGNTLNLMTNIIEKLFL